MSDSRCEQFQELVSAFVDDRLEGAELLLLEGHLEICRGCRQFEAEVRRFRELLQAAEAFAPLRRPPPGFAARVAARASADLQPRVVLFPGPPVVRRSLAGWVGLAAAAAAALLFFAWSWQRLLPGVPPAQQGVSRSVVVQSVAAAEEGNLEDWVRQHTLLARDATILGPAEEVVFASYHTGEGTGR